MGSSSSSLILKASSTYQYFLNPQITIGRLSSFNHPAVSSDVRRKSRSQVSRRYRVNLYANAANPPIARFPPSENTPVDKSLMTLRLRSVVFTLETSDKASSLYARLFFCSNSLNKTRTGSKANNRGFIRLISNGATPVTSHQAHVRLVRKLHTRERVSQDGIPAAFFRESGRASRRRPRRYRRSKYRRLRNVAANFGRCTQRERRDPPATVDNSRRKYSHVSHSGSIYQI